MSTCWSVCVLRQRSRRTKVLYDMYLVHSSSINCVVYRDTRCAMSSRRRIIVFRFRRQRGKRVAFDVGYVAQTITTMARRLLCKLTASRLVNPRFLEEVGWKVFNIRSSNSAPSSTSVATVRVPPRSCPLMSSSSSGFSVEEGAGLSPGGPRHCCCCWPILLVPATLRTKVAAPVSSSARSFATL